MIAAGSRSGRRPAARILVRRRYRDVRLLLRRLAERSNAQDIHKARVAIRRLRTILADIAPALDAHRCTSLRDGLKLIADELGVVRDADIRAAILLPWLRDMKARAEDPRDGPAGALATTLQAARRDARRRLRARLCSTSIHELLLRIDRQAGSDLLFRRGADADALLAGALRRRCGRMSRALRKKSASPAQRHALRIRVKKCRYLLDACGEEPDTRSGKVAQALLRDLQDCLGELNDLAQARRWLKKQDAEAGVSQALGKRLEDRSGRSLSRLKRLRRRFRRLGSGAVVPGEAHR